MNTIETWEALDLAIAQAAVLSQHRERLNEYRDDYALSELARFIILEPGDQIDPPGPPEYVTAHSGFNESVFVIDDSGYGMVVLAPF